MLALALLTSCAYYEDRIADVGAQLAPSDERVIHGDTHFSPEERAAFERALISWQTFTRGRVRLSVRWDLDEHNFLDVYPALYRVYATDETGRKGGKTEGDSIWWVPDTCPDKQACAMHEIGHFLGLCVPPREHVPYAGQVMSARNPSHVFGAADYRECIEVGVCRERKLDITTVTVTIDPSIPNVTPEYP